MRATMILFAAAAAACGSVHDRSACASSADCPAGSYCARTGDGDVCWPDATAPIVSGVSIACDHDPCLRSDVLHVTATITDDAELLGADVSLLGSTAIPLARAGGATWTANLPLARFPLEAFEAEVVATVTARDGARNERSAAAGPAVVTRLAWEKKLDVGVFSLTPPAVMADGTVVAAGTNGKVYLVSWDGAGITSVVVGGGQITAAPAIGERAIWVGSEDFSLYAVSLDGSGLIANVGVNAEGPIKGSIAVLPQSTKEWGLASSGSGRVAAASTTPFEYGRSTSTNTFTVGPVVRGDGKICAATATATATLRCYSFDGGAFSEDFSVNVGVNVSAPLAVDAAGRVWTGSQDAKLNETTTAGITTTAASLPGSIIDSPVVLSGGDIVVGDQSGILHRFSPDGTQVWPSEPNLGGPVLSPMVLAGTAATLVVPTKSGKIHALQSDGSTIWSATLQGVPELRAGNIYTRPGQPPDEVTSIAYFAGADGWLHAVIVDGKLDGNAPWPKAFHDPRNTNRAGAQP